MGRAGRQLTANRISYRRNGTFMPWIKKSSYDPRFFWMGVLAAGIVLGLFIGYERWGSTAALVLMVERELAAS
jgi:hypothetical protein